MSKLEAGVNHRAGQTGPLERQEADFVPVEEIRDYQEVGLRTRAVPPQVLDRCGQSRIFRYQKNSSPSSSGFPAFANPR
jgi:hypothetical protein